MKKRLMSTVLTGSFLLGRIMGEGQISIKYNKLIVEQIVRCR